MISEKGSAVSREAGPFDLPTPDWLAGGSNLTGSFLRSATDLAAWVNKTERWFLDHPCKMGRSDCEHRIVLEV